MSTKLTTSGASPWAAPIGLLERVCIAPAASAQGSALPVAGRYGAPQLTAHAAAHATLAAPFAAAAKPNGMDRTDKARVPEPRGRQR